jgi:hypothetical protein
VFADHSARADGENKVPTMTVALQSRVGSKESGSAREGVRERERDSPRPQELSRAARHGASHTQEPRALHVMTSHRVSEFRRKVWITFMTHDSRGMVRKLHPVGSICKPLGFQSSCKARVECFDVAIGMLIEITGSYPFCRHEFISHLDFNRRARFARRPLDCM